MSISKTMKPIGLQAGVLLGYSLSILFQKLSFSHGSLISSLLKYTVFNIIFLMIYLFYKNIAVSWEKIYYALFPAFFYAIATIALFFGLYSMNPILVGFLSQSQILVGYFLAVYLLKESIPKLEFPFAFLSMGGMILFAYSHWIYFASFSGIAAVFIYCSLNALSNGLIRLYEKKSHFAISLLINQLVLFVCLGGYILFLRVPITQSDTNITMAFFASLCAVISLISFFKTAHYIPYRHTVLLSGLFPLILSAITWPFFPIKVSLVNIVGMLLLFFGLFGVHLVTEKKDLSIFGIE